MTDRNVILQGLQKLGPSEKWDDITRDLAERFGISIDDVMAGRLTHSQMLDFEILVQQKSADKEDLDSVLDAYNPAVLPKVVGKTYRLTEEEYQAVIKYVQKRLKIGKYKCVQRILSIVQKQEVSGGIELILPNETSSKKRLSASTIEEALNLVVSARNEGVIDDAIKKAAESDGEALLNITRPPKIPLKTPVSQADRRRYTMTILDYNRLLSRMTTLDATKNWASTLLISGFIKPYGTSRMELDFHSIWGVGYEQLVKDPRPAKNTFLSASNWQAIFNFLMNYHCVTSETESEVRPLIPDLPKPPPSLLQRLVSKIFSRFGIWI